MIINFPITKVLKCFINTTEISQNISLFGKTFSWSRSGTNCRHAFGDARKN